MNNNLQKYKSFENLSKKTRSRQPNFKSSSQEKSLIKNSAHQSKYKQKQTSDFQLIITQKQQSLNEDYFCFDGQQKKKSLEFSIDDIKEKNVTQKVSLQFYEQHQGFSSNNQTEQQQTVELIKLKAKLHELQKNFLNTERYYTQTISNLKQQLYTKSRQGQILNETLNFLLSEQKAISRETEHLANTILLSSSSSSFDNHHQNQYYQVDNNNKIDDIQGLKFKESKKYANKNENKNFQYINIKRSSSRGKISVQQKKIRRSRVINNQKIFLKAKNTEPKIVII